MPLPIALITAVIGRLIDTKKATSPTNITTAIGTASVGGSAYLLLLESDDPMLKVMGCIGVVLGVVLSLYKDHASK